MFEGWGIFVSTMRSWGAHEVTLFRDELPVAIVNSVIFGFVIGGTLNWLRNRQFRSARDGIALASSQIHIGAIRTADKILTAFSARDALAYKRFRADAEDYRDQLEDFFLTYIAHFNVRQATMFGLYRDRLDDALDRLFFKKVTSRMAPDKEEFRLENMPDLFDLDHFGPLLGKSEDRFTQVDELYADFIRSLGFWSAKKFSARADAAKADKSLRDLHQKLNSVVPARDRPVVGALVSTAQPSTGLPT